MNWNRLGLYTATTTIKIDTKDNGLRSGFFRFCDRMVGKLETVLNACLPCRKEAIADIAMRCRILEICRDIRRDL